jgi:YVTN family beta-propeller protein
VAVNPTNGYIYATGNYNSPPGSVSVITPGNTVLTTITVGSYAYGVAVAP